MRSSFLAAAAALSIAGAASAQTQDADGRTVYAAAWFERYAPATALDMASRVPGFTLQEGDDVRGFAGAAGNVVINGARPSAKAESLQEVLRRIPAAQVERMELVPGQAIGAEYRARPFVLNVVTARRASGLSGTAEAEMQYAALSDRFAPSGALSVTRRDGDTMLNLAASYENRNNPDGGYDEFFLTPSRTLIERRDKFNQYHLQEGSLAAVWAWTPSEERAVRLNARLSRFENPLRHRSFVSDANGPLRRDTIHQKPTREGGEIGGDVAHPLFGGVAKVVGLARRDHFNGQDEYLRKALDGTPLGGGTFQEVDNRTGETVGRLTWAREDLFGWSVETGAEAALNTLESRVDLFTIAASGARTAVPLPASDVEVEETRGEAFISGGRALTPELQFDWGAAWETSTLTVSGGATAERSLSFLKPRASLEWRPEPQWRLRASVDRLVSQLNFDDFVSSAEIANDRVNSANPEIEPERTWRWSLLLERKVLTEGSVRVVLNYDQVEAVVDRIPTGLGFDGPGNLGDGTRVWSETTLDLPLDAFKVPGGRFNLRWILQDSDVPDPYTNTGRYFSSEVPWSLSWNFRQDLRGRKWAWGVNYYADGELPQYRLNEIDAWNTKNLNFGAFAELRPTAKTTLTLRANNVLDRRIYRRRDFFSPDRSAPERFAHEDRIRYSGVTYTLELKRSFG